jgi:hypothetical protein
MGAVDRDHLHWIVAPFVVAGVLLHIWVPARLLPEWWMGVAAGVPLVAAAVAVWFVASGPYRRAAVVVVAAVGIGLAVNSLWPIVFLLPALVTAAKSRAIMVQTARRPPGP